jgi:hypothetical protein
MKILTSCALAMLFLSAGALAGAHHRASSAQLSPSVNLTIIEKTEVGPVVELIGSFPE